MVKINSFGIQSSQGIHLGGAGIFVPGGAPASSFPQVASLVSYYKQNGNGNDSKGTNTLTNTNVTYSAGKIGDAGVYASATSHTTTDMFVASTEFTVSFWMKPITRSGGVQYLWANSNSSGVEEAMYFNAGTLDFVTRFGGYSTISYSGGLTDGVWYHIVVQITSSGLKMYLNDSLVASNATTGTIAKFTSQGLYIGQNGFGNYANEGIDEFAVWKTALTASDITALYNGGAGITYP